VTCCDARPTPGQYHCTKCCNTFGTLALFDQHQAVRYGPPSHLACRRPDRLRGVLRDEHGVWRTAEDAEAITARVRAMREARRDKSAPGPQFR
jgi:hypothetical protein